MKTKIQNKMFTNEAYYYVLCMCVCVYMHTLACA